jgi:type III pantothenate kinase
MRLLIDIGNSRLKWRGMGDSPGVSNAVDREGPGLGVDPARIWSGVEIPASVVVVSVAGEEADRELASWCQKEWAVEPWFAVSQAEAYGIRNGYTDPSQLGNDRWVALVAARGLTLQPFIVVDCGTAVTIDGVDSQGIHQGGVIMPGVDVAADALNRNIAGIKSGLADEASPFARTTTDAVVSGSLYGIAGGIERVVDTFRSRLGREASLLITGGLAPRVLPLIRIDFSHEQDLVLLGLEQIAREEAFR